MIRMLILTVDTDGRVLRDRLERPAGMLAWNVPFAPPGAKWRRMITREHIITAWEAGRSVKTSPAHFQAREGRQCAPLRSIAEKDAPEAAE